jgi:2-polyprenyl-3-methyl-5-hydroxy-6-metoxy-1,4-benzoquinol methylase
VSFRQDLYGRYLSTFKSRQVPPSTAWWEHKYLPLLADLPRNASILEIGCGSGELLGFLSQRAFSNCRGIDISPEQVALATQRGLPVALGDVFEVLLDEKYQAIIAVDVLEHFTRDELLRLAPLLFEALEPHGRLLIQTANGAGLFPRQVIYGDLTHLTIFTPESLAQLLVPCGFADLRCYETGPIPLRLRGKLDVIAWQLIKYAANAIRSIEAGKRQTIWTENFICLARKPA